MARLSVLSFTQLVWCPLMKETETFSVAIAGIYWIRLCLTVCHLSYALPHCRLRRMLEIGTDSYLCLRMRKARLGEMKSLAQCYTASERWAWPSHLAVRSQSPTPCCLSGDGYLPGRTWVWLGVVGAVGPCLPAAYTVSWGCFEAASSALAPQKASSPVGVGFMMWFPSSCLWRSALLPRVRSPWVAENVLLRWSRSCLPCVQDASCLCHHVVSQWRCEGMSGAVWFGIRGHTLATPLLTSPLITCDVRVHPQASFSCTECNLKKKKPILAWMELHLP